jgi:hypothetical protein
MEIKDLVNRFEILYPDNTLLSDLRKLLNHDDNFALYRLLDHFTSSHLVKAIKLLTIEKVNYNLDCFSQGQIKSKKWLIDELTKLDLELGTVFLCAGWYATLATMLFESSIKIDKIRSFDVDPSCVSIAEVFNKPWVSENWKFKSITENILVIDYNSHSWTSWSSANNRMSNPITDVPNTIINTSCEHLTQEQYDKWLMKMHNHVLIVLQSNNYEYPEHVRTAANLDEFIQQSHVDVIWSGELELPLYTRYMIIGKHIQRKNDERN